MKLLTVLLALLLTACTTISNAPQPSDAVLQDLRDAAFNLSTAQQMGILPAKDAAADCVQGVLAQIDIPAQSFAPRTSGLVSGASVLYIQTQQAKALADKARTGDDCDALVGKMVRDAARLGVRIAPLPKLPLP